MSRISKLMIKGIRNFDDEHDGPAIKFSRPLTLILGPNGTGKTTIIECLRYALSGEFPPNSDKGKSFIHDPMLKNIASVMVLGNVKVEIVDCRGDRLTVSRTIEGRRLNQTVKFRTLDSTLSRLNRKTKEKVTLNKTCAALDYEVMSAMGVSKAILNYVLFCHQDDSDWPFDAAKKLKDRFDEIFDTTRYNKALDCLRKIIKDKQAELKGILTEQRALLLIVEEVKSKKNHLENFKTRKEETSQKINDLTEKLKPINQRLDELRKIEMEYSKWQIQEGQKKTEFKLLQQQIMAHRREIKELYEGTTEELNDEIFSYQEILSEKTNQISELERNLEEIKEKETKMNNIMGERRVAVGTLRQQVRDLTLRISKRNENLREMMTSWEFNENMESELSENDVQETIKKFEEKIREMKQEIEIKRIEQDEESERLQKIVNSLRSERTTIESQLNQYTRELQNVKAEIRTNCELLKKSELMEEKLNRVDARLTEANTKFEEFHKNSEINDLKLKINEATIVEEKTERKLNILEKEITQLREQSSLRMKLDSLYAELTEKETEIEALRNKNGFTLEMLLGKKEFPAGSMTDTVNEIQTVLNERIRNLKKEIDNVQYETTKIETSVKHKKEELEKKKMEIRRDKSKVELHCGDYTNYREVLLMNSKKVKDMEDKRGMYAYQGSAYKEYIKKLSEPKSCCPLCNRGFSDAKEAIDLVGVLKNDMCGHPARLQNCEKELSLQRKKYDALLQLQPIVEKIEQFEEHDMTKMRQEIEENVELLSAAKGKMKKLQESLSEPEKKLAMCKDMVGDMALWDRYSNEIETINLSIQDIQEHLRDAGVESERTIQEAETEQNDLTKILKESRKEIKNFQIALDSRNEELRRVTEVRTKLLEEQLNIHHEMQEIKQAREKLDSLRKKEAEIVENVENVEKRSKEIVTQCETAIENLERTKKNIRAVQDFDRKILQDREKEFDRISSMQTEVEKLVSRKIDQQLKTIEEKLESALKMANKFKAEGINCEAEITKLREEVVANETRKRNLTDNLAMRRKEVEAENVKLEYEELKEKLSATGYQDVMEERKILSGRRDVAEREKNIAEGTEEELNRNIGQLTHELKKPEYRCAHSNYKEKCVELAVTRLCVKDLLMYCKVLDIGMIEYHEERMCTVNKIMKKLWDLIYTGTDTTSIQIKMDATTSAVDKKRSFNYKLVQIKHGVEMDMKGRCSAGQRVLASIILRLALAETFCEKCGVLALDEPTTNLDEQNAKSLADALHSYVNRRSKSQKNFQLIVITHDDNFIPKLGQLSKNNSYYQLYRYGSGTSGIKCVSFDGPLETEIGDKESSGEENDGELKTENPEPSLVKKSVQKCHRKKATFD